MILHAPTKLGETLLKLRTALLCVISVSLHSLAERGQRPGKLLNMRKVITRNGDAWVCCERRTLGVKYPHFTFVSFGVNTT